MRWFFTTAITTTTATITGDENKHLNLVMRAKPGDRVTCFNGNGLVAECVVENTSKAQTLLKVEQIATETQPSTKLVLAAAAIKGDRQDTLIRQATELGVTNIVLLESERSEVKFGGTKKDKIERQLISHAKQCHRAFLPQIEFSTLKEFLPKCKKYVILCGSLTTKATILQQNQQKIKNNNVVALIGPEGGFSEEEEKQIDSYGAIRLSLGKNVLRADTAASMLVSLVKAIKEW